MSDAVECTLDELQRTAENGGNAVIETIGGLLGIAAGVTAFLVAPEA